MKPKVCILRTDGTNCDEELFYAFEKFGAAPQYVHVNQLRAKSKKLKAFQILALPGGFSYGDDVASGKILAVELISYLKDQLQEFISKNGLVIGICNGFQTLVRTGLLPFGHLGKMEATLAQNESGHFECRWIRLKIEKSRCPFLNLYLKPGLPTYSKPGLDNGLENGVFELAVNHGEGRFFANNETIATMEQSNLVVFRYVDGKGKPTGHYPENPNGSINAIAGVCDPTGRILGLMPHPEKFVDITQYPNWRRGKVTEPHGAFIFKQLIRFATV
ncbi:phosphoribosylformylglycinamidine synthase I [Candidatus Curtissbacteria bacterium]|nr:phosphoribosylformylglycinamidine synthase I [Candidatus Curtissbacteria bacterium]